MLYDIGANRSVVRDEQVNIRLTGSEKRRWESGVEKGGYNSLSHLARRGVEVELHRRLDYQGDTPVTNYELAEYVRHLRAAVDATQDIAIENMETLDTLDYRTSKLLDDE